MSSSSFVCALGKLQNVEFFYIAKALVRAVKGSDGCWLVTKFGVHLPQVGVDYETVKKVASACESLGFDSIWLTDHLLPIVGSPSEPYLECWTTLSALVEATKSVRIGTQVVCILFRYPQILAKMASTLDVISRGRVELGLGAGWYKPEAEAYGVPFPKASVRIAMLKEALIVLERMWSEESPVFHGEYYNINGASCNPKPVQKPHPPIWIGTLTGGRLMSEIIAKYADVWTVGSWYLPSINEYRQKMEQLRLNCLEVGREFGSLKKALGVGCILAKNKGALAEKTRKFRPAQISIENYKTTQMQIHGTPEECVEIMRNYADVGVDHFVMDFPDVTDLETLGLFKEAVMPYL
jgi:alkanesulfonate monooxygenase SsuD/methylene tetrahydromethanopterin reductase-like flavin-dependent oxidoreductase (luciferase family)